MIDPTYSPARVAHMYAPNLPQAGDYWKAHRTISFVIDRRSKFAVALSILHKRQIIPYCVMFEQLGGDYRRYVFTQKQMERVVAVAQEAMLI